MSDEQKIETEEEAEVEGHGNHPRADAAADLAEGNHPMAPEDEAEVEGHGNIHSASGNIHSGRGNIHGRR